MQIPSSHNVAPAPRRGYVFLGPDALPADALAELDGLALLLAPVERALDPGGHDYEHREEDDDAQREEGDDFVVGLSHEPFAVVAGVGGGRRNEPGREHENWCQEPHSGRNDTLSLAVAESFLCIVEIPKGSRNKYEYDHEHDVIKLDRFLFSSVVYPTDYGFIPDTLSLDGDPLDVMVLVSEPTFPGCMIEVKPIGLFRMEDDQGVDDKVLAVPLTDPGWNTLEGLDGVSEQLQNEIAHFFTVYKQLENKKVEVDGWYPCEDALKVIAASRKRFRESSGPGH